MTPRIVIPASLRHSRETGRVKTLTSGHERPIRHSRESGNPGVLEGSPRAVSPLHPAWIPAFAGMTISGAVASLGWGFDTAWKAGIQGLERHVVVGCGGVPPRPHPTWIPAFAR